MSKSINPEKVADIIKDVAATIIMPRFQNLSDDEIKSKTGPTDLVTIADLESEEALTKHFKDILPGSYVVGEEAVSKNEISTSILATESDPVWVIDPVDGTNNFATGNPTFGVIVTLVQGGQTVQGWIYDVPGDRTAITERGSGVEINGARKTYPANDKPLKESKGFISRKFLPKQMRDELKETLENEFGCIETYMCCAHEYMDILEGKANYSMYSRIKPWDHLTGGMMMEEAGGFVRKWDRSSYGAGDEKGGLITAANQETWEEIYNHTLAKYI